MSTGGSGPPRFVTIPLAGFNILIGLVGGVYASWLAVFVGGLSVHPQDGIPPLLLAVACGLLGVTGILLLLPAAGHPRRWAARAAGLAAVAAAGGIATAFWRNAALEPSEGGMLALAGVTAPVALVAVAEAAYLWWARPPRAPAEPTAAPDRAGG